MTSQTKQPVAIPDADSSPGAEAPHGRRKRYAVIGASKRAMDMFIGPILNTYGAYAELVAVLDRDPSRLEWCVRTKGLDVPTYGPKQFDEMVRDTRPDAVIVATPDGSHHEYLIRVLGHDLEAISEKPLTIDEDKCQQVLRAERASRGRVRVTFNYRYTAAITRIRQLVASGRIGRVVSGDLNWYLDTQHGASYFQRWNRLREVSGGLSVHKSCHHLDMVQWVVGQRAQEVYAYGARNFYGPEGVHNPLRPEQVGDGRTCPTCDVRDRCPYYMRWHRDQRRGARPGEADGEADKAEVYSNYSTQQCVFDPDVNIEDTYAACIRYDGGAMLTYSLNASNPCEGMRLGLNGTQGRIEYENWHGRQLPYPGAGDQPIHLTPMFGARESIQVVKHSGGHAGGDPMLLDELFIGPDPQMDVQRAAGIQDGIEAVLTGVAIHRSANEHAPVSVEEMRRRVFE